MKKNIHKQHSDVTTQQSNRTKALKLTNGSRVAVIGGGPAGSLFGYFLLDMAQRVDLSIDLDIYEPKNFSKLGPAGCNMCGGIISESLVRTLATEGINLPSSVVQRGIDSYVMHTDIGSTRIKTPLFEKSIASVHRGAGPLGLHETKWLSFDGHLLNLTQSKGANIIHDRVIGVDWEDNHPKVRTRHKQSDIYDLLVIAIGVNSTALGLFGELVGVHYKPPKTTKTYISDIFMGHESVQECFGNSMHVFLLDIPRLEFAAIIPKGDYIAICLLGEQIDTGLVEMFLHDPKVRQCFPNDWVSPKHFCHCSPRMNIGRSSYPFVDRMVFIGDCGISRLYKDGIGAAYHTAKGAVKTVIFDGISAGDFQKNYYGKTCDAIDKDNKIGKIVFLVTHLLKKFPRLMRGILRMVAKEQQEQDMQKRMSMVLWDTFSGSASYQNIFFRTLHPYFLGNLFWNIVLSLFSFTERQLKKEETTNNSLGKFYRDGEIIVNQGEEANCMYVIQEGFVEVFLIQAEKEIHLATLQEGDFFGEIPLFERETRHTSVRAMGTVRVITVDRRTLNTSIQKDPSLAYRILQTMARRISVLSDEVVKLKAQTKDK